MFFAYLLFGLVVVFMFLILIEGFGIETQIVTVLLDFFLGSRK